MRLHDRRLAIAAAMMFAMAGCTHTRDPLHDWLRDRRVDAYATPGVAERNAFAGAFAGALRGEATADWAALGYETRLDADGIALREALPSRGWGAYVVRRGDARPLVVQAPHADSDRLTGDIALGLHRVAGGRVLALNTAPRRLAGADQAHAPDGPFAALATAAATLDALVLQVHGYGEDTAHRYALADDAVVVSNGSVTPDPALRAMARCLRTAGFDARLFPEEAGYPGGTRNAVGHAVAATGRGRFVHLELGARLRSALVRHPQRLRAFAECL